MCACMLLHAATCCYMLLHGNSAKRTCSIRCSKMEEGESADLRQPHFTFNSFNSFCSLHRDSRRLERGRRTGVQPTSVGTKPTSGGTKPTLFILFPMFHLSNSQNVRQSNISAPPSAKRQAPFSNLFLFSILLFPCHMPSPVCQGLFTIIILFDE